MFQFSWSKAPPHRGRKLRFRPEVETLNDRITPSASVNVNTASNVHAIDPLIYGSAFATQAQLADLNLAINREGGNSSDTYNWEANATNLASDWYYESYPAPPALLATGQTMDDYVSQTMAGGAQPDLTVPIMPYVATLGTNGAVEGSFPVTAYGAQQSTDPYYPNFGNGVNGSGQNITDTNFYNYVANSPSFEQGWIQHLLTTFGTPGNGGVQYFTLGNEPGLWNSTHMDIHPVGETNTELLNDFINYGNMIKSIDPNAQIIGPEEWGWTNYFVDGADAAAGNYGATYTGTGGQQLNVEQWLLQQLDQYQTEYGTRLLNYFSLHYYPQESVSGDNNGGVDSDNVDQATELLRNQVTRSLWDPNYVDPSWIASTGINDGKVDLIPMMQSWVNTYYPGTLTGITEYNFGAEGNMNGATTQADVYGIFGQQGLDLATRWTTPATGSPTYLAMKIWRNYDGNDSGFGNISVGAAVANPDDTDAFAALRSSDGALTVAVVNKNLYSASTPTTSITVNLSGFDSNGIAQEWQLAAVSPSNQNNAAITHLSNITFSGDSFTINVPTESVTMFVIEPGNGPTVSINTTGMFVNTPTLTIHGFGFDPTAGYNAVTFNDGAAGTVTSATATTLTVTFSTHPSAAGSLTAVVTSDAVSSGAAVQVGTVSFVTSVAVNGDDAPIVDISSNGASTVTVTTDGNNGFTAGNTVVIAGYTGANAGYDGTFQVQSASGDTFTVTNTATGLTALTPSNGGNAGFAISPNTASALRGAQRSMVDSVVYTFSSPVSLTAANFALTVAAATTSRPALAPAPATLVPGMTLTSLNGGSLWVATWVSGGGTGATVTGQSIADGVYTLTLTDSNEATDTFYRLYGDIVGYNATSDTGSINNSDSLSFTHSYLLSTGASLYLADADYNDDGVINNTDSLQFTHRYLSVWSAFTPTI